MKNIKLVTRLLFFSFLCISCSKTVDKENTEHLNGYWLIEKVEREGEKQEEVREYSMSTTIDYIELEEDLNGFRMKVQPQPDSTFKTTQNKEYFQLKEENDSLKFYYETNLDKWTENVEFIEEDRFSVENEKGITYTYRRFKSLAKELEKHEEGE